MNESGFSATCYSFFRTFQEFPVSQKITFLHSAILQTERHFFAVWRKLKAETKTFVTSIKTVLTHNLFMYDTPFIKTIKNANFEHFDILKYSRNFTGKKTGVVVSKARVWWVRQSSPKSPRVLARPPIQNDLIIKTVIKYAGLYYTRLQFWGWRS